MKEIKTVLMSIRAEHNQNIEKGLKIAELRLKPPKCELPFKVLTYESGANGRHKVVNEWICDNITEWRICMGIPAHLPKTACVSVEDILSYSGKECKNIFEMRITNLKIYDKPKYLNEFAPFCNYNGDLCEGCSHYVEAFGGCCKTLKRPPQSWQYIQGGRKMNKEQERRMHI